MERQEIKHKYEQVEQYKEQLELNHIKRKALIVNVLVVILIGILLYFPISKLMDFNQIYASLFFLSLILIINLGYYHIENDVYNNYKLSMFMTIIGLYVTANTLIFQFKTPSIFTVLFLTYAITSIYQDRKAMVLSSALLFFSGYLMVLRYPKIFATKLDENPQILYVQIFLIIFSLLLTLSSYILIKRKTFFYNQLASIKESEIRNIDLLQEIEYIKTKEVKSFSKYYDNITEFNKALSKKIGVPNLLGRRIEILQELKNKTPLELSNKYSDFTLEELKALELLEFETHKKMHYLSIKASKIADIKVTKKEIFSESQFKSFKHVGDSKYVQIISFVVFYTLLKIDKPYLKKLDEERLRDILYHSEFFYKVDRDIIDIYLENSEVFETIVNDYLKGGW